MSYRQKIQRYNFRINLAGKTDTTKIKAYQKQYEMY